MNKSLKQAWYLFALLLLLSSALSLDAQGLSNLRVKWISVEADSLQLDTLSLVPNSWDLKEKGQSFSIPIEDYSIDPTTAWLHWNSKPAADSVFVRYRVLSMSLAKGARHKDQSLLSDLAGQPLKQVYKTSTLGDDLFDLGGLSYNGSFARGINLGNSQDLSVNSAFNLQMSGMLSEDIEILASITDNNIPFQAQGNTQQLQEFDRIFIQLTKGRHRLIVGDYDLARPDAYFMNYKKKLQGASFSTSQVDGSGGLWSGRGSVAVARGRYNRMSFFGEEGNQGPYKLRGANGETFIIILSGSERVYIDGKELIRGQQNDYVIDYNLGEIIFMPQQLITKDKRIVVEFEYSQRDYLRSLYQAEAAYEREKWAVKMHFLSEQDAKNQAGLQELSGDQKQFLSTIGDQLDLSFVPGIDTVEYQENQVLYAQQDTVINGVSQLIYAYSTNPLEAIYSLRFSRVGAGNGDYLLSASTVNGRVYEWIAPDPQTGLSRGEYSPLTQLIPPKQQRLLSMGGSFRPNEKTRLEAEFAVSDFDVNTFSDLDAENDQSIGIHLKGEHAFTLSAKENWELVLLGELERAGKDFRFFEQYRNVEFKRDWNSQLDQGTYLETLASAGGILRHRENGNLKYRFASFQQDGFYQANRNEVDGFFKKNDWELKAGANYLSSKATEEDSEYWRSHLLLTKTFGANKWEAGLRGLLEDNRIDLDVFADSLSFRSFAFQEAELFLKSPQKLPNKWGAAFLFREDFTPSGGDLVVLTQAQELKLDGALSKNAKSQLQWNLNLRQLRVNDTSRTNLRDAFTVLGELQYNFVAWNGLLKSSSWYQLGGGQQQKVEYFFRPVQANLGDFVWRDNNDNGIQELDEFELATLNSLEDSVRYIREAIPTGEFEATKLVAFNQTIQLNPKVLWKNHTGFRGFLAKFSYQSNWQFKRQFANDADFNAYIPVFLSFDDALLFSTNASCRNTLFVNRSGSKYRGEFYYNLFSQKILLTGGTDGSERTELGSKNRFFLGRTFSANLDAALLKNVNTSEAFESREYSLSGYSLEPSLRYQKDSKLNLEFSYRRRLLENAIGLGELGIENSLNWRARYNVVTKSSISARFSFISNDYADFPTNSAVAFQILDGLQPGINYVWDLNFQNQFANNLQLNVSYSGKKSETSKVIHVARMELRAIF